MIFASEKESTNFDIGLFADCEDFVRFHFFDSLSIGVRNKVLSNTCSNLILMVIFDLDEMVLKLKRFEESILDSVGYGFVDSIVL